MAGVSVSIMQQHLRLAAALGQQLTVWSPRRILLPSVSQCNQVAGASCSRVYYIRRITWRRTGRLLVDVVGRMMTHGQTHGRLHVAWFRIFDEYSYTTPLEDLILLD